MPQDVNGILDAFGVKLVSDIRQSLRTNNVTFGGGADSRLAAKTDFVIKQTSSGVIFELHMPPEWYWIDHGRKPGPVSQVGQKSISDWVKKKGIVGKFQTENLVTRQSLQDNAKRKIKTLKKLPFDKAVKALTFLISRKVATHGYKGNGFLESVLNDGRIAALQSDLRQAYKSQIIVDIQI